jgi:hypothetical protein
MTDGELIAEARRLAGVRLWSAAAQALAREQLRQLADRLERVTAAGEADAFPYCRHCRRGTWSKPCPGCGGPACARCGRCPDCDDPAPCPDHRPVLDSEAGWYCAACGSEAPPV